MKFQSMIKSAVLILFSVGAGNLIADNKFSFPSDSQFRSYQYPPQAPMQPIMNQRTTSQAPYVFGQNTNPQQRMRTPAQFNNNATQRQFIQRQQAQNRQYQNNNQSNNFPFSNNMMPFGNNSNNNLNPFSNNSMPFTNNSSGMLPTNPMNNIFGNSNNNNMNMPFFNSNNSNKKKAWGDKRNIWPDFYTDFTDEAWDEMTSGPRKLGTMPGGWRFPYISTPDPVTVSDAITNQFPPIAEEAGNMMDFSDWGVFD